MNHQTAYTLSSELLTNQSNSKHPTFIHLPCALVIRQEPILNHKAFLIILTTCRASVPTQVLTIILHTHMDKHTLCE